MQLQDIPDKVIEDNLLQHLDWNDLLRLRRLCTWTKKITDGYLKENLDRAPELEINEGKDKTFGAFLQMGIPTRKLFINNATLGYQFYEDDKAREFLEDYGPLIKDLRVTQITLVNNALCREKELAFMEGLSNLESLEVEYCVSGKSGAELKKSKPYKEKDMAIDLVLPETFKKLQKVKFGRDLKDTDLGMAERKKRTRDFLMQCPRLRSISFPTSWLSQTPKGSEDTSGTLAGDLVFFVLSFEERPNDFGYKLKAEANLEWIDFQGCHQNYEEWLKEQWDCALPFNWYSSQVFLGICKKSKEIGYKLANVSPYWFYAKDSLNLDGTKANRDGIGEPIVSLVGLDPIIMDVKMPNLERITIPSTSFCVTGGKRAEWPSLKILDITVDGTEGTCWDFVGAKVVKEVNGNHDQSTENVFAFLFCGIERPSVTELYLKFVEDVKKVNNNSGVPKPIKGKEFLKGKDQVRWGMEEKLTVPRVGMIVKCCVNLKVLRIGNWQGSSQALLVFWKELGEMLEEVELENCGNVTDFSFFGGEENSPVFLKLKNLKKLALKGIDKMSKVTDLLFTRIISQMKLKQLVLTSDKALENITKDGINSLLQGPFAETIERFPFQGWSFSDVTPKEFEEMGKKFRSYNML